MAWVVNLSNGETLKEGSVIAGEKSPWQKLLDYCKHNNLEITGIWLNVKDVMVAAMPQKMCDGYFHAYEATKMIFRNESSLKQGVGSVIGDKVFITWIDLKSKEVHQDTRPLSEVKVHTTIND